jgi:hypothetical protein
MLLDEYFCLADDIRVGVNVYHGGLRKITMCKMEMKIKTQTSSSTRRSRAIHHKMHLSQRFNRVKRLSMNKEKEIESA